MVSVSWLQISDGQPSNLSSCVPPVRTGSTVFCVQIRGQTREPDQFGESGFVASMRPRLAWKATQVEYCGRCAVGKAGEQSSIPVDQDLLCGLLGSGGVVGPFDECAVLELRAGADERHEMGRVDRPPA